jgi:hypothetical protein
MFYGQAIKHGVEQQTCVELRKKNNQTLPYYVLWGKKFTNKFIHN